MSVAPDYSFYLKGASDKSVLLVHGLTGSPAEMKFIGKQLHRRGFTVYAPMLAGHGADVETLTRTRYEDWLESLRAGLHRLKQETREVYAAGICVGGGLALYLAHLEPAMLSGVAVYAAALDYDGWNQPKWSRLARHLRGMLIHVPAIRKVRFEETPPFGIKSGRIRTALMKEGAGIEGALPYFPAVSLYENYRLNHVLKKALPATTTPTLLIHAREDDVAHPRNAYAIQKRHGGRCEVAMLEDSYHMIHIDQERHKVAELTAAFFGMPRMEWEDAYGTTGV